MSFATECPHPWRETRRIERVCDWGGSRQTLQARRILLTLSYMKDSPHVRTLTTAVGVVEERSALEAGERLVVAVHAEWSEAEQSAEL